MAKLALAFLGTLQVTLDGHAVTAFGTDKARALGVPCARNRTSALPRNVGSDVLAQPCGQSRGDSTLFEEWVLVQREVLHRQMLDALDALTLYHLARNELKAARTYAARQIELEPWHEEAHRALMEAFAREGQRAAALAQYDACRKILAREFSATPSEETTHLYEKIRADTLTATPTPASVDALAALAQYHRVQGDLTLAHDYQTQVLAHQDASGDKRARACAHQQLGIILQTQNKWRAARMHFRAALALFQAIDDWLGQGEALGALAQVREQRGDLSGARADWQRALKIAEAAGAPTLCARILTRLGMLAQRQGKLTEARGYWARALEIQQRIGDRAAIADLQVCLRACGKVG
ncbi:MAG: tetratricopeptide repeat protein [Anaerolineae bacterium]|nr:tetratricopeptide repeat protein [Anaerolineae bacterium]